MALPTVAAQGEWGDFTRALGVDDERVAFAPMPFETAGESFPGSAFYYLDDAPRLTTDLAQLRESEGTLETVEFAESHGAGAAAQPPAASRRRRRRGTTMTSAENLHQAQWRRTLNSVTRRVATAPHYQASGRVVRATGLVLEAVGLRTPLGSACRIEITAPGSDRPDFAEAEVVGFSGDKLFLMPLAEISGLVPGARVFPLGDGEDTGARRFPLGDALLGRVVDGNGRPLDGGAPLDEVPHGTLASPPMNPLARAPIDTQIDVGIRAINTLLSIGRGQRMGLFAGSGVGKSVLLGMMARYTGADVIVVGLIGERGREVKDFIDNLGA